MRRLQEAEVFENAEKLNLKLRIFSWSKFLLSKPLIVRKFLVLINLLIRGGLRSYLEKKLTSVIKIKKQIL